MVVVTRGKLRILGVADIVGLFSTKVLMRMHLTHVAPYVLTFFKENISLDDNGTKIICAHKDGNTPIIMPCSWIYLDVHFLAKPENPINILVPVAVSLSTVVVDLLIMLLIVVIFMVVIIRRRKQSELSITVLLYSYLLLCTIFSRVTGSSTCTC